MIWGTTGWSASFQSQGKLCSQSSWNPWSSGINMNLLETAQRRMWSPAPEIQQYNLGASWLERPVCTSRELGVLVDNKLNMSQTSSLQWGRLTPDWAALTRTWPATQGQWLSPNVQPLWSHVHRPVLSFLMQTIYSQTGGNREEGNYDLEGSGVLDMQGKAEQTVWSA